MQGSYNPVAHHQGPPNAAPYGSERSGQMQGGPPSPYAPRAPYAAAPQQQAPPQYQARGQYQTAPAPGGPPPQQVQHNSQPYQAPPTAGQPPPQHYHAALQHAPYAAEPPPGAGTKRRLENGAAPEAKRPAPASSARETVFRLLASSRKIGSIIGRGGEIIKQLKSETGARIKVADAVPNCEERVVIMSCAPDPSVQWNSAQRAVFEVHRCLVEGEYNAAAAPAAVVTRFLVNQHQANQLLQRLDVTNQVRSESGVDIKVLGPQEIPACALSNDRVLQLTGTAQTLPRALEILSQHFKENPPKEKPGGPPAAVAAMLARSHLPAAVPAAVQYAAPPPSYASQPPPYAAAPSSYSLPPLTHQPYPAVPPQYSAAPSY